MTVSARHGTCGGGTVRAPARRGEGDGERGREREREGERGREREREGERGREREREGERVAGCAEECADTLTYPTIECVLLL